MKAPVKKARNPIRAGAMHWAPEARLIAIALSLELAWELAHFPLYTCWQANGWKELSGLLIYGLGGDLLILLGAYWAIAALYGCRRWPRCGPVAGGSLFILAGAGYTVLSEWVNVRLMGTWAYAEAMPIVPVLEVGLTPLLQWLLLPPFILALLRRGFVHHQERW